VSNAPNHCQSLKYYDAIFTFSVIAKSNTADIVSHRIVGSERASLNHNQRYTFSSLAFITGHPLTLEAPATTNNEKVFVQGYAKPGASVAVRLYYDNSILKTFTANSAGRYSGTVTLPEIAQSKDFALTATEGTKTSNKVTIRYSKRLLYTKELWMNSKQAGQFDKSYLLINNSVMYDKGAPMVVDAQSGKTQNIMLGDDVKFRVKMSDDKAVQKVFVGLETADGQSLGSVPCLLQGDGYWHSESQNGTNYGNAARYRVTYVLNIGHEYMSPAEIEANMRESEAALAAYVPPARMFTDAEAFENELRLAMIETLPPEMRGAAYTPLAGGGTRVSFATLDGTPGYYDMTLEEITGGELAALANKAHANGIQMGGGYLYNEVSYTATLTGGGTKTYEGSDFDRAIFDRQRLHPGESAEQILTNRLGIEKVRMNSITYSDATRQTPGMTGEAIRHGVEVTSGVLSTLGDIASGAGAPIGGGAGYVNAAASLMSIPGVVMNAQTAQDIYKGYTAMLANLRNLKESECYQKLSDSDKHLFDIQLNAIAAYEEDFAKFSSNHTKHAIAKGAFSVVTAGITVAPGGGFVTTGVKVGSGILSLTASSSELDIWADGERIAQLQQYKTLYEGLRNITNMLKESMSMACGEKQSDPSQGNYNFIYDPQGIVYDGTLDYPVAGVRAELWTANDGNGTGAKYWNDAEDYDQINPQITAGDGMFSWFTPEGWWQVRLFDTQARSRAYKSARANG
jgi:hypothetical protein